DPAANTWTATGALLTPRVLHITALLPSGKVLVAGGTRGTSLGLTASAELYDPASGTWAATGALATARANSQGVVLPSGKVVAMGGSTGNSSNPALASTELYDPADGTWTTVGSLGAARWGHTATLLPSGEVLVAAGENGNTQLSSAERFNPSTRTWRAAASMSAARSRPTATLLASGKVLVAGSFPNGTSAELYDPASDAWRAVPRLPGSFDHHQATLLDSGKVLLTQFFNPSAVLYDPANLYAPVAQGTGIVVEEDGSRTGTVRATDADMDPVTYSVVTRPAHGEVTFTGPGFTYTPDADFFGNDSFTFKASDGSLESNVATVSIRVTPVDDVPEASDGFLRLSEDSSRALVLAATDVDGDTLSYTIVTPPAHGTLSGTAPNLSYRPAANYHGPDSFTFRVSDGRTQSNVATMELMVDPVNDAPVVRHQALTTAEEVALQVTVTATDADGDPLSYTVQTGTPFFGTVSGTPPNLTYTPAADYFGTERFFVTVSDGKTVSSADIAVTVTPVNDVPVTVSYPQATAEDTGVLVILIGLDADGEPLTYEVVSGPSHGTLSGTAPLLTYRPSADFHGADSFTYRVADAATSSGVSTVSLTVTPENDAPVALALSRGTGQGAAVAVTLQATDVDGDALTYAVVTGPSHGTLTGTPPALTYVPAAGYTGSDSFTFQAHDGTLASNEATVTLTVKVAPVAQDVSVTTRQGTAVSVVLSAQDPNGDALTYTVVEPPAHGTLSGTPPELLYTPADGFSGTDSFRYQAHNGAVGAEGTVSITVTPRGCGGCASTGGGALNALWVLAGMSLLRRRANARAGAPSRGEGEREPHGSRP
ncbi:MAG TPA: Ig-like domain-containing protein, partial [Myxococcaceae bacterium]|nr:Ig-like domain-containing protein [Myxococcaceae bacterium]